MAVRRMDFHARAMRWNNHIRLPALLHDHRLTWRGSVLHSRNGGRSDRVAERFVVVQLALAGTVGMVGSVGLGRGGRRAGACTGARARVITRPRVGARRVRRTRNEGRRRRMRRPGGVHVHARLPARVCTRDRLRARRARRVVVARLGGIAVVGDCVRAREVLRRRRLGLVGLRLRWQKRVAVAGCLLRLLADPAGDAVLLCDELLVCVWRVVVFCHGGRSSGEDVRNMWSWTR